VNEPLDPYAQPVPGSAPDSAATAAPPAAWGPPPPGYAPLPPGYSVPPGYAPVSPKNGLGIAALVLGIIGALSGLIPLLFWLAGVLGILALVFGLVGRGRAKRGEATNGKMATWGFVLGIVSMVLAVIGIIIIATAVKHLGNDLDCLGKAQTQAQIDACG
jgi:hypothetical protein